MRPRRGNARRGAPGVVGRFETVRHEILAPRLQMSSAFARYAASLAALSQAWPVAVVTLLYLVGCVP